MYLTQIVIHEGQATIPVAGRITPEPRFDRGRSDPMLKTGKEHLESIRDGRVVYLGRERVDDVTTHPAFRNAAHTVAALYDLKAEPSNRDLMSYEEYGERHSMWFLRAKSAGDLKQRMQAHKRISDATYGLLGRSMDHVTSFVTGMATEPLAPSCVTTKFIEARTNPAGNGV